MGRLYVRDLTPGQHLEDQVFLVKSKDLRTTTNGDLYIHAVLVDKTGQLLARMWQATESIYNYMPDGGFLTFKGRTENYKGNLQFIIDAIGPAETGTFDVADFLPVTKFDIDEMYNRVVEILARITHPDLKVLVDEFLNDQELMARFRKAPAAAIMHHAYIGGLLEHTLNVLELALRVLPLYPKISLDLVLAGIFLHDLGKAKELAFDTAIGYTDEGQLIGHITQAVIWIDKKCDVIAEKTGEPFPDQLRWALEHIVLSHHGQLEFGSPKIPALPEAVVVHYLDNLDAKTNVYLSEIEKSKDVGSTWCNYNPTLQTKVFRPDVMGVRASSSESTESKPTAGEKLLS